MKHAENELWGLSRTAFVSEGLFDMQRSEFLRVTPEAAGIRSCDIEWLLDRLEEDHTCMHGLMIMRHGWICAEGWWAPFAPGLRHGLQSLSKTYAATAVGIAYTEGLLDLDDRLIDIFPEESPEQPGAFLQHLKVRDVLCMGCGMDEMPVPGKDWVRQFLATPVNHEPGTAFMYNSLGSSMLGEIIRKLTGESLHEYLTKRLFDVIGIDADNLRWLCHPDGCEVGGGGLYATTEDNLRLMKLYLDGGVWEGQRILAEDYVKLATSLQNDSATEEAVNPPAKDNFVGYGYQIWMCRYPGAYRADGAMGQFSICVPDLDMILSINETAIGAEGIQITLDYVWEFLRRIDPSKEMLEEDPEAAAKLAYRLKHLSCENPQYTPYRKELERFSGKRWRVKKDSGAAGPTIDMPMMKEMLGGEFTQGMEELCFTFTPRAAVLTFRQDGQEYELPIALDGTRQQSEQKIRGEVVSKVLASGSFADERTFTLTVMWPETCFTRTLIFRFPEEESRTLTIRAETFPLTTTIPGGTKKMMEPEIFTAEC